MSEEDNYTEEETESTGLGGYVAPDGNAEQSLNFEDDTLYEMFRESLPQELQNNPTIKNTKSITALADQLINAQSALGTKRLPTPQDDWDDEAYDEFYNNFRPKDSEYSVPENEELGLNDEFSIADESLQDLADIANDMGLSQRQFDKLYHEYANLINKSEVAALENQQEAISSMRNEMVGEWGDNYKANLQSANDAYEALTQDVPELRELVESEPTIANHPAILKMFHRIAEAAGDTLPISGNNPSTGFANESIHNIKSEIQALDASYAELIMANPSQMSMSDRTKRSEVLERRTELYKQLYG